MDKFLRVTKNPPFTHNVLLNLPACLYVSLLACPTSDQQHQRRRTVRAKDTNPMLVMPYLLTLPVSPANKKTLGASKRPGSGSIRFRTTRGRSSVWFQRSSGSDRSKKTSILSVDCVTLCRRDVYALRVYYFSLEYIIYYYYTTIAGFPAYCGAPEHEIGYATQPFLLISIKPPSIRDSNDQRTKPL